MQHCQIASSLLHLLLLGFRIDTWKLLSISFSIRGIFSDDMLLEYIQLAGSCNSLSLTGILFIVHAGEIGAREGTGAVKRLELPGRLYLVQRVGVAWVRLRTVKVGLFGCLFD